MAPSEDTTPPRFTWRRTSLSAAAPAAAVLLLLVAGMIDMPRAHQALGLTDAHNRTDSKVGHRCDAACGRRRVSAVGSPDGPAPDRP